MAEENNIPQLQKCHQKYEQVTIFYDIQSKNNQNVSGDCTVTAPQRYCKGHGNVEGRRHIVDDDLKVTQHQQEGCNYFIEKISNVQLYSQSGEEQGSNSWQSELAK